MDSDFEDDILDIDEEWLENGWYLDKNEESKIFTGSNVSLDVELVDVSDVLHSLKDSYHRHLPLAISTKTFARPKKGRSDLSNIISPEPVVSAGSPKLRRRLTTTINPSPALIPHLEQLSRTNNRPLSNSEDLNWEDGALGGELSGEVKPAHRRISLLASRSYNRPVFNPEHVNLADGAGEREAFAEEEGMTPRRPTVPASLLQRLQELKERNTVRSPFSKTRQVPSKAMTASLMMSEIPDWEEGGPNSYLSLGDTSFLNLGDSMGNSMEFDRRMTFGGIELPPGLPIVDMNKTYDNVEELINLNSTFTKEDLQLNETKNLGQQENWEEVRNNEGIKVSEMLKTISSKLFDTAYSKSEKNEENVARQSENKLDGTFKKEDAELNMVEDTNALNTTEIKLSPKLFSNMRISENHNTTLNGTFTSNEQVPLLTKVGQFTRTELNSTLTKVETVQHTVEVESQIKQAPSREDLTDHQPYVYSTATYSRPSTRMSASPVRSGLPMRRFSGYRASTEDLARSPARSDGTLTPVDGGPAHGTYTRNSPVERCGSEDEQMSTASDHSLPSQGSLEDLHDNGRVVRQVSTPKISAGLPKLKVLRMSPISHNQPISPARSNEKLDSQRVQHKMPHFKPALMPSTDNYKIMVKKSETSTTGMRAPVKAVPVNTRMSGLPKPAGRALPTRIPAGRLSSIPRPPTRLATTINKGTS